MATQTLIKYSLTDFNKIKNDGFEYNLSPDVIKIIQELAEQVGAPEYVKTPVFEKKQERTINRSNFHKNNKSKEISDDEWNIVRNFQATTLAKKEGIDVYISEIRKRLNKITDKTFDKLRNEIVGEMEHIVDEFDSSKPEVKVELNKIGDAVFAIASSNSFYSEMYAEIFKQLMDNFQFMKEIFETNFEKFNGSLFKNVEYVDPNLDYDKFCENNKKNEQRRAICLFYVNLMNKEVIEPNYLINMINELQEYINKLISEPGNKNIVDELSEVLGILITKSHETLSSESGWDDIVENVKTIAEMKNGSQPSITNKAIFKHMDIIDML